MSLSMNIRDTLLKQNEINNIDKEFKSLLPVGDIYYERKIYQQNMYKVSDKSISLKKKAKETKSTIVVEKEDDAFELIESDISDEEKDEEKDEDEDKDKENKSSKYSLDEMIEIPKEVSKESVFSEPDEPDKTDEPEELDKTDEDDNSDKADKSDELKKEITSDDKSEQISDKQTLKEEELNKSSKSDSKKIDLHKSLNDNLFLNIKIKDDGKVIVDENKEKIDQSGGVKKIKLSEKFEFF